MKIKIGTKEVEVVIIKTYDCPAGTAYYIIEYQIGGICIHKASTKAICGTPNPISMLDGSHEWTETHYEDVQAPDPRPADRNVKAGTSGGRPAWWEERSKTHRQAILDALEQVVAE